MPLEYCQEYSRRPQALLIETEDVRLDRVRRFQEPGGSAQSSSLLLEHQLSLAHGGSALLALVTAPPPCGGLAPCSGCRAARLALACPA